MADRPQHLLLYPDTSNNHPSGHPAASLTGVASGDQHVLSTQPLDHKPGARPSVSYRPVNATPASTAIRRKRKWWEFTSSSNGSTGNGHIQDMVPPTSILRTQSLQPTVAVREIHPTIDEDDITNAAPQADVIEAFPADGGPPQLDGEGTIRRHTLERELQDAEQDTSPPPLRERLFPGGYKEPPKVHWRTSFKSKAGSFSNWVMTPLGAIITIYLLNVVGWGAMYFFMAIHATPAMCKPNCDHYSSPRKKWMEACAQILNALFCVTGFGLLPFRIRQVQLLLMYRFGCRGDYGLRKLAGHHSRWLRLPGSEQLQPDFMHRADLSALDDHEDKRTAIPLCKNPADPLTGRRAPPTPTWMVDVFVWCNFSNSSFQIVLCGFMWSYEQWERPDWGMWTFIGLACLGPAVAGLIVYDAKLKIMRIEGVPWDSSQETKEERKRRKDIERAERLPVHWPVSGKRPNMMAKEEVEEMNPLRRWVMERMIARR